MKKLIKGLAIASLGWYLMTPPLTRTSDHMFMWHADFPLSDWHIRERYDSGDDCNVAIDKLLHIKPLSIGGNNYVLTFQCIPDDDSRLAK